MTFMSKFIYHWYQLRKNYHQALYDCCLDHQTKTKLKYKIEYHQKKAEQLKPIKA